MASQFRRLLAESRDLASGELVSFLPSDADPALITNFAYGGVASHEESTKHLLEFLREIDRTYPKSLILFEDLYSSPEDSGLAIAVRAWLR